MATELELELSQQEVPQQSLVVKTARPLSQDEVNENGLPDYDVVAEDNTGFVVGGRYGVEPKAGDVIDLWTSQYSLIRGMAVNGQVLFYKTHGQQKVDHQREVAADRAHKAQAWADDEDGRRTKWSDALGRLPEVFQDRIAKFKRTNPDFEWDYGNYELMCCEDAVKIADFCQARNPGAPISVWEEGRDGSLDTAMGVHEGHSGNSYFFTRLLAHHYLEDPELVVLEHGALTPLVGCETYGCPHPYASGDER